MTDTTPRLAAETGGTFTDIIFFRQGEGGPHLAAMKIPSTPDAPEQAILTGFDRLGPAWPGLGSVLHGSTVGTNAVLERKGARTALVVTEGFKDILEIQRGDKRNIYDIFYRRTRPLVRREHVFPIRERVAADGSVLTPLDSDALAGIVGQLKAAEIQAVAICLLHSYVNPDHELAVKRHLEAALPGTLVLASCEILPQFREYERASTVAMSAYVSPVMTRYVNRLDQALRERGFGGSLLITQSNGGVLPARAVEREVVRTLLSGPAAGVTGAARTAAAAGLDNTITLDMGGTSTDVALITGGMPALTIENAINDLPIAVPMLDIETVGAGGGSIARLDRYGMLHVGPESAGAQPGPACYGKGGTEATVTDADVVRGVVRPKRFAGGAMELDVAAAAAVIGRLGGQLGRSPEATAAAVVHVVEANMMEAIRVVSTQRGYDPRDYTLLAFGGAGPVHAVGVARELGIDRVFVPPLAGILSAYGLFVSPISRDYVRTRIQLLSSLTAEDVARVFAALVGEARAEFAEYGYAGDQLRFSLSLDARYRGQAFELSLPVPEPEADPMALVEAFHAVHERRYGYVFAEGEVEAVNYRVKAAVQREPPDIATSPATHAAPIAEAGRVFDGDEWRDCTFFTAASLPVGFRAAGCAVIEDETYTCFVPVGWQFEALATGGFMLNRIS